MGRRGVDRLLYTAGSDTEEEADVAVSSHASVLSAIIPSNESDLTTLITADILERKRPV